MEIPNMAGLFKVNAVADSFHTFYNVLKRVTTGSTPFYRVANLDRARQRLVRTKPIRKALAQIAFNWTRYSVQLKA